MTTMPQGGGDASQRGNPRPTPVRAGYAEEIQRKADDDGDKRR
jgi:hypothetical protein